jgi:hypothetical protein
MRERTPWHESDNPSTVARGATWRVGVWTLAFIVIAMVIGGIVVGINTLTANPAGRAQAYRQKESGTNRVFAQQLFEKQYADVQATKAKIKAAEKTRTISPEAETRYEGLLSYCASVVGEYNAAARSYTTEQFRASDLPSQLDLDTDCEPSK